MNRVELGDVVVLRENKVISTKLPPRWLRWLTTVAQNEHWKVSPAFSGDDIMQEGLRWYIQLQRDPRKSFDSEKHFGTYWRRCVIREVMEMAKKSKVIPHDREESYLAKVMELRRYHAPRKDSADDRLVQEEIDNTIPPILLELVNTIKARDMRFKARLPFIVPDFSNKERLNKQLCQRAGIPFGLVDFATPLIEYLNSIKA